MGAIPCGCSCVKKITMENSVTKKMVNLLPVAAPFVEVAVTGTNNYPMMFVLKETGGEAIFDLWPLLKLHLSK